MGRHRKIARALILAIAFGAMPMEPATAQDLGQGIVPERLLGASARRSKDKISKATGTIGQNDSTPESAIRLGKEAPLYTYVVGISFIKDGREGTCTGILLSKRLILTAAHCGCGASYSVTQDLKMNGGKFIHVAGPPILFDSLVCQRSEIRPGYDLALLRLDRDAERIERNYQPVPPLAFSLANLTRTGRELIVVGYGLTETRASGVRMQASVPVFTPDCAQRQYVVAGCMPFLEMILSASVRTTGPRTVDTCSGDSGGPVFAMMPVEGSVVPVLVAVT